MLKCKECIHGQKIPGDAHMSCNKGAVILGEVNAHGIQSGWFMFPFNFDPIWATECIGFKDKSIKLENLSRDDLLIALKTEFSWLNVMMKENFSSIIPILKTKVEHNLATMKKVLDAKDRDSALWSDEDIIEAIKAIRNV